MKYIMVVLILFVSSFCFAGGGGAGNDWPWYSCGDSVSIKVIQSHWYSIWRNGKEDDIYYESKTASQLSGALYSAYKSGYNSVISTEPNGTYEFNHADRLALTVVLNNEKLVCTRVPGTGYSWN